MDVDAEMSGSLSSISLNQQTSTTSAVSEKTEEAKKDEMMSRLLKTKD